MADITITNQRLTPLIDRVSTPVWNRGDPFDADLTGTYSGTVTPPVGVNVQDIKITILHKGSKRVVATTRPNADGSFSFTGLDKTNSQDYMMFDEVPGTTNSIIYDKINVL